MKLSTVLHFKSCTPMWLLLFFLFFSKTVSAQFSTLCNSNHITRLYSIEYRDAIIGFNNQYRHDFFDYVLIPEPSFF
ncbi:hypothetical protein [uncultured Algibacter sp.]|uniref:hypothetical protein n=1 Tax=uncultured Algibacter sp. TaxID=298659 RepID=UPI003216D1A2